MFVKYLKFYDKGIYVKNDGYLGVFYNNGSSYWVDGYLNTSAPKVYSYTGFALIEQWNLSVYYAGINTEGGTDIYKIYFDSGWKYARITNTGNLYIDANSEIHMGYNNNLGFYVRSDGYMTAFYNCGDTYMCVDRVHPSGAPKVKSGTGFHVVPTWDNQIYYVGVDNNIYKIYWDGEWTYEKMSKDNYFDGVKVYSDLHYADNNIFFVGYADRKIHYLLNYASELKSAESVLDQEYFSNYQPINEVDGLLQSSRINIYPNPAMDNCSISSNIDISSLYIYDQFGKLIDVKYDLNNKSMELDISCFEYGVYLIVFRLTNNNQETLKLVKMPR